MAGSGHRKSGALKRLSDKSKAHCAKFGASVKKRRADLPVIAEGARQRLPGDLHLDTEALTNLAEGVYTYTSRKSARARMAWWQVRAKRRGLAPLPLDEAKLKLAGALLKKGSYRSAPQYLYTLKEMHVDSGAAWSPSLASLFEDVKRSCERGLGASKQADALPLAESCGGDAIQRHALQVGRSGSVGWHLVDAEGT